MRELFERYELTYTSGSLVQQVGSAWKKVFRLALPNDMLRKATAVANAGTLTQLFSRKAIVPDTSAA